MKDVALTISEVSYLATLRLLIFRTATEYLGRAGGQPNSREIEEITQKVKVSRLRKLRRLGNDKQSFEAQMNRIFAEVIYEYSQAVGR
jgi:hypothetical protein